MFDQKQLRKYIYSALSFILFFTVLHIAIVALYNTYKTEDYRLLTISSSENARSKPVKLIGDKTFNTTFTAIADNLGIVAIRFNTTSQTKPGYILFRIKEVGAETWYYSNTYKSDQFQNDALFQIGFPPLYESKNKKYELEVKSLFGNNDNYLQISNLQYVPKFTYPKSELLSVPKLITFVSNKLFSFVYNTNLLGWIFVLLPLLVVTVFYILHKKYFFSFFALWVVFLNDIKQNCNLKTILNWRRKNEFLLIIYYLMLIWVSIIQRDLPQNYQTLLRTIGAISIAGVIAYFMLRIKSKKAHWLIALTLVTYIILKISFFDTEPKWDGRLYFGYMQQSFDVISPFLTNFSKVFSYVGHPAHGYATYLMIGRLITLDPIINMHIMNTLLGVFTLVCIYAFLQKFFDMSRLNAAIMTGLFAFNPLINAISLSPNIDYPVVCFFAIALCLLVYDKIFLSSFVFTLMAFSKETGLLIYLLFISTEFALMLSGRSHIFNQYFKRLTESGEHKLTKLVVYLIILLTPVFLFGLRYLLSAGETWKGNYYVHPEIPFLIHPELLYQRIGQVFILNFQWILIIATILMSIRFVKQFERSYVFIFSGSIYLIIMTLYNTYVHPRYIASLHLFIFLILASLVASIKKWSRGHLVILIFLQLLLLVQNFHSIDPVSNYYFDTYRWGNYKLLKLGDDLQSRCDGMIYNFQYTYVQKLYKKFHETTKGQYTVILSDVKNLKGSGNGWAHEFPHAPYIEAKNLTSSHILGDNVYYLFLPWLTNNVDISMSKVKDTYLIEKKGRIELNGYWLEFYKLRKRT